MLYENLVWFTLLGICVLVMRRLWHAAHSALPSSVPSPKRKTPRLLKPHTPHDCPVCGRPHPTPHVGNARKPGVLPWRERKSARGKPKRICTAGYACPTPDCDNFGNTDSTFHALVGDGTHGANDIQGFKCQACATRLALEPLNAIRTALGLLPDAF